MDTAPLDSMRRHARPHKVGIVFPAAQHKAANRGCIMIISSHSPQSCPDTLFKTLPNHPSAAAGCYGDGNGRQTEALIGRRKENFSL